MTPHSKLSFEGEQYHCVGNTNLGRTVRICYKPEISGPVVGWRETDQGIEFLVQYTVPYGEDSDVFSAYPQQTLEAIWEYQTS